MDKYNFNLLRIDNSNNGYHNVQFKFPNGLWLNVYHSHFRFDIGYKLCVSWIKENSF